MSFIDMYAECAGSMEDAWENVPQDIFSQNVVCWNGIDSWDMWNVGKHRWAPELLFQQTQQEGGLARLCHFHLVGECMC